MCIKTNNERAAGKFLAVVRQKAPSAKRCIKTFGLRAGVSLPMTVRKHRAPKGALRLSEALRLALGGEGSESTERQKVH